MKYLFCLTIILASCISKNVDRDPYTTIEDIKARDIIRASIDFHGGLENWNAIKTLEYKKDFALLSPDGSVEKSYRQEHKYTYDPYLMEIISYENGQQNISKFQNNKYTKEVDGQLQSIDSQKIAKGMNSSLYVIGIPFKLLDTGAMHTYIGETTLEDGRLVDVVSVEYNPTKYPSHSSSEKWEYYFDKQDRKVVANKVTSSDHLNFVENLSYERIAGIMFNKRRKSYRIDSLDNKLYLRASYHYHDYKVDDKAE